MPVDPLIENTRRLDRLERYLDDQKRFGPAFKSVAADPFMFNRLHGWWTFGNNDNTTVFDVSGMSRDLTMNGGVFSSTYNNNIAYMDFDGANDYLSRADEAGLDITGALCLGGWFWLDALATTRLLASKWNNVGNQRAYQMYWDSGTGAFACNVSGDGVGNVGVNSAVSVSASTWYFVVMRYTPSIELAIFVNMIKATNVTSIPASLFNSNQIFAIGTRGSLDLFLDGRSALCFLCSSDLTDIVLRNFYERTKPIFQTV